MYGFAALGLWGSPYVGAQPYNQETQQQTVKQKVPIPPPAEISRVEKEIRELYKDEYKLIDPPKKKAFGDKLLANGRDANDNAQKYVLLRDAANTLADLLELDSAFEAVKALGESFEGYNALDTYDKCLTAAQKKARTKDEASKVAEAYLQLADAALQEKNYKFATSSAKSAESVGKKAGNTPLVEKASNLVKAIPDMEKEYSLVKKAEETLKMNPNDPEANTVLGKYKGFVENDWDTALKYLSKSMNGLGTIADQEILLRSGGMDNADAIYHVANLWYEQSNKTTNALDKTRCATHSLELLKIAQSKNPTGLTQDKINKAIGELEKKVSPVNGTAKAGWIDLMPLINTKRDAVAGDWSLIEGKIMAPPADGNYRKLQIPYSPPLEYNLSFIVEPLGGENYCHFGIVVNGKQCLVILAPNWAAFEKLDGKGYGSNKKTIEGLLVPNKKNAVNCVVRNTGFNISVNGKNAITWNGDTNKLSLEESWRVPNNSALFICGSRSTYAISSISIKPISGGQGQILNR